CNPAPAPASGGPLTETFFLPLSLLDRILVPPVVPGGPKAEFVGLPVRLRKTRRSRAASRNLIHVEAAMALAEFPASVLDRLLGYVVAHQGVWIATASDVASLA